MFKKILATIALAIAALLPAQQPQAIEFPPPPQPIFKVNAEITNGVAPGYWPTANATGLVINLSSGTSFCNGSIQNYAGGTLTMTNGSTNYIYLDETNSCIPSVSTTVFGTNQFPVAIVVTSGGNVTSVTDVRTFFDTSNSSIVNITNGLILQAIPPTTGQYVVVYPTASSPGETGQGFANSSDTSGVLGSIYLVSPLAEEGTSSIVWSLPQLPSYVSPSNVTAVYAFATSYAMALSPPSGTLGTCGGTGAPWTINTPGDHTGSIVATASGITTYNLAIGGGSPSQSTVDMTALTGANFGTATITANFSTSGDCLGGYDVIVPAVGFFVYYTGTAPPANNVVQVAPPLTYQNGVLSFPSTFDVAVDTGSTNAYSATVPGYSVTSGGFSSISVNTQVWLVPASANTSTAPTLSLNGSTALTIEGPTGGVLCTSGGGDIQSGQPAELVYSGQDNKWKLMNPLVCVGSGVNQLTGDVTAGPGSGSQAATVVSTHLSSPLPVAQGGNGTASPSLVAGTGINISGTWPNQTVTNTGGGGGGGTPANVIYASAGNGTVSGCALNSNLMTGGGTDATACLQAQLDYLGSNGGGTLIMNGPALVSNAKQGSTNSVDGNIQTTCLQTHSNVTIQVPTGGGVYLANSSNCTILGNNISGNPSTTTYQTNMRVLGGFWNGNNANQSKYEQGNSANTWNFGFWFGGFNGLEISGVTLYNVTTFNYFLTNGENLVMNNDTTTVVDSTTNQDGIHIDGTFTNGVINNFTDNNGSDDPIALNTDEGVQNYNTGSGAWEYQRYPNSGGAINNVTVNGETLVTTNNVFRFIGYTTTNGVATLNNVAFRNVTGTQTGTGVNNSGLTSCTNILIDNWTPVNSGSSTIVNPNLEGSSCTTTAGQQDFGTLATGYKSSGGNWNFLASVSNLFPVGLYLGQSTSGGAGNGGGIAFYPDNVSTTAPYWQLSVLNSSHTWDWFGSGDMSLTGSDCGSAFCLPASGGIEQASGGSASNCYATNGTVISGCGGSVSVNGSTVASPNFNGTTPSVSASTGINNTYQVSSSSVSSYTPVATGSTPGVIKPDGSTCTVTSGVLTCTGSSGSTSIAICADTSGSGTAQSCTTSPSFTPVAGSVIAYTTSTANTGTGLTLNVNSLGAKSVAKWQATTTLAAGDICSGKYILMTYDGTNWETSTICNAPSGGGGGNYTNIGSTVTWVCGGSGSGSFSGGAYTFSECSSITISSIPGTYLNLRSVVSGYEAGTSDQVIIVSANGDTTAADYLCERLAAQDTTTAVGNCGSLGSSSGGVGIGAWGTSASGQPAGGAVFEVPFYSSTTLQKLFLSGETFAANPNYTGTHSGSWSNTAAITSLRIVSGDGGNLTGLIAIYGEN
jgi:hypothetical protein